MRTCLVFVLLIAGCSGAPSKSPLPAPSAERLELQSGWRTGATGGSGPFALWEVREEGLALTEVRHHDQDRFNLHWRDRVRFQDGEIDVEVRPDDGTIDQGGGPMWRARDENNYYVCRFNPLEANFRLYVVQDGVRRQLASTMVPGPLSGWHHVQVEHDGAHIVCTLDGRHRIEATDDTLPDEGGVGLWTKADARTSFLNLRVHTRP